MIRMSTQKTELRPQALRTDDGATAELVDGDIVVRNPGGELVLSYSAATGMRVHAPAGDLTLAAPSGRVRIEARDGVDMQSAAHVRMQAPVLELAGERTTLESTELSIKAERIQTVASEIGQAVGRWELRAERVVEHARDAFREVQDLLQTRADRVRTLVKGTCQLLAGRTEIVSDEDTVVDGKRVLLG